MKTSILNLLMYSSIKFIHVFLVQVIAIQLLMANVSKSQQLENIQISFAIHNANLEQVFQELETQTNFRFGYDRKVIKSGVRFTFNGRKQSLQAILLTIAEKADLKFKRINQQILVLKDNHRLPRQEKIEIIQSREISGKVIDQVHGDPLPGATVVVKSSNIGSTVDAEGKFLLMVPKESETLIISFIGYQSQEITLDNRSYYEIRLQEDVSALNEVVVTALGIQRNMNELGYAVQKVEGEKLTTAREVNLTNSLAGRVAGVMVYNGSSGTGSSSNIVIRGETSFGANVQPLVVLDGVPISNETIASLSVGPNIRDIDYGNGLMNINPDDLESINVLKGPAASALYGARGANGVLVLTTKTGRKSQGLGVSVNSGVTFENVLRLPQYQNKYGQGNGDFWYLNGFGDGINDGTDESWGPLLDGRLIAQFNSPALDVNGNPVRAGDIVARGGTMDRKVLPLDNITPTPWVAQPDNVRNFYETGITFTNNVALAGNNEHGSYRISYTNVDSKGVIPNTNFKRNSLSLSLDQYLASKLNLKGYVNYINSGSDNRPSNGYNSENPNFTFMWYGRQVNTAAERNYWQKGQEGLQQFGYNSSWNDNPYFTLYENTNAFNQDRILSNIALTYEFTPSLNITLRNGLDTYNEIRRSKRAKSTQSYPQGAYKEDDISLLELNTDFLFNYVRQAGDFNLRVSLGGNRRQSEITNKSNFAGELIAPEVYSLTNSNVPVLVDQKRFNKRVHSLYWLSQVAYRDWLFLDFTLRNDWSSTLPVDNNSYLYGSVSASANLSSIIDLPSFISFAKVRASYASVGNDTDPYQLNQTFSIVDPYNGTQGATINPVLINKNFLPEKMNAFEIGTDISFLQDRLRLDFTYYNTVSKDQIINLPQPISTGYNSRVTNGAKITNQGIEVVLSARPIETRKFNWNTNLNFSSSRTTVNDLPGGVNQYVINYSSMYTNKDATVWIIATNGGEIGDMWGTGFVEIDGQVLHDANGLPVRDPQLRKLGNYNPDFMLGLDNNFSLGNVHFGFLFDLRYGGEIVSRTKSIATGSGTLIESLPGREEGIVGEGVLNIGTEESPEYVKNTIKVPAKNYYKSKFDRINESAVLYDASFLKLRELSLGYTFDNALLSRLGLQSVTLSAVARNLAVWTENPHFDPELMAQQGSRFVRGVEDVSYPSNRSYGFNLKINF